MPVMSEPDRKRADELAFKAAIDKTYGPFVPDDEVDILISLRRDLWDMFRAGIEYERKRTRTTVVPDESDEAENSSNPRPIRDMPR